MSTTEHSDHPQQPTAVSNHDCSEGAAAAMRAGDERSCDGESAPQTDGSTEDLSPRDAAANAPAASLTPTLSMWGPPGRTESPSVASGASSDDEGDGSDAETAASENRSVGKGDSACVSRVMERYESLSKAEPKKEIQSQHLAVGDKIKPTETNSTWLQCGVSINGKDGKTHLCVLCVLEHGVDPKLRSKKQCRHKWLDSSNAKKHVTRQHEDMMVVVTSGKFKFADLFSKSRYPGGDPSQISLLESMARMSKDGQSRSAVASSIANSGDQIPQAPPAVRDYMNEMLLRIMINHLLPYNMVEWPDMRACIKQIASLPSCNLEIESRRNIIRRRDALFEQMRQRLLEDIVRTMLSIGQGAFFLQLDGVKSARGECTPILLSWVDENFNRKTVTLAVAYESGKTAEKYAQTVRQALFDLDICQFIRELPLEERHNLNAYKHFCLFLRGRLAEPMEGFHEDDILLSMSTGKNRLHFS